MTDHIAQIPFIDIAVQDAVREAMLDGKAAILFDLSVDNIVWANGAASQLFGYDAIGDFLSAGVSPLSTTLRQLKAAAERGPTLPQAMLLRIAAGMRSQLAQAHIQIVALPHVDAKFVLLVIERADHEDNDYVLARDAIAGLEEDGAGAAIVGVDGAIIAAGALFSSLELPHSELHALSQEVIDEDDRLVKRLVSRGVGRNYIAAGIGRLSENPVRNLVVAMETDQIDEPVRPAKSAASVPAPTSPYPAVNVTAPPLVEADEEDDTEFDFFGEEEAPIETRKPHLPNLQRGPVRFVWKTDADNHFIELSNEFGEAVGKNAADIIGRKMHDIIKVFELDPSGDIELSMARRDTWSGKTVLWPIEGTDLRVPVDLAALPYYSRERAFEGYRGFGILRMADAVIDPEELGLALVDGPFNKGEREQSTDRNDIDLAQADDEADQEIDPFEGEPPALQSSNITPLRRTADNDKIVPLDARRDRKTKREALDENEAAAFERIGKALGKKPDDQPVSQAGEIDDTNETISTSDDTAAPIFEPQKDKSDTTDITASPDLPLGLGPDELEALPLPLLIVRGETALYGNRSFGQMTGYDDLSLLNERGISALFGDEDTSLSETDSQDDRKLTVICADGSEVSARTHLQLVPWIGSKAMMFAFEPESANDHIESTSDENSLLAVSDSLKSAAFDEVAEMRAILDTATDGVVVIGQEGTIRSLNGSASALFGYRNEDVIGKSFSILFAHESQRAAMDYLNGFSNNSVASLLNEGREVLAREQNGGFLPVFMTIGRLPTSNGYCAVLRDITPWKQTEIALEKAKSDAESASNTKSEFLAKVSHEIRTPLNAIIGFSELMSEERFGPVGNERYKDYLVDINKSGRHVLDLVNDLLDISKIEAGEQELEFESVILNEAVADAVSMIQPQANRNRIIVRSSLESNLPSVVADTRSIKQILLNLLSNAIRFTQSGGQVVVTTNYTSRGTVILRIRDTGIGMSAREIETALRPFKQVSTLDTGEGTGLGLPLTKALVEANRAEFEISSEPGRGTSVEITFPPARVLAD